MVPVEPGPRDAEEAIRARNPGEEVKPGPRDAEEAIRVRTTSGEVLLSIPWSKAKDLTGDRLKQEVAGAGGKRREEVKLVCGTSALRNSEPLAPLLQRTAGVLEVLAVFQAFPEYDESRDAGEQLLALRGLLLDADEDRQLMAARKFRQVLKSGPSPPIQEVIDAGAVPRLVELARSGPSTQVQHEALWALANIASGSADQTGAVVDEGAVELLVGKVSAEDPDIAEPAAWGLGNIAGGAERLRDRVLEAGGLAPILESLRREDPPATLLRTAAWAISNLCRGDPPPAAAAVLPAVRPLVDLLSTVADEEVVRDACWSLFYLCRQDECVEPAVRAGLVARASELLEHPSEHALGPALKAIGAVAAGGGARTWAVASDEPCLGRLASLTCHKKRTVRRLACLVLSDIMAGACDQIQAAVAAGALPRLVDALDGDATVAKEAVRAFANLEGSALPEQFEAAVDAGCIAPLVKMASHPDVPRELSGRALRGIMRAGGKLKADRGLGGNPFVRPFVEAGGVQILEGWEDDASLDIVRAEVQAVVADAAA
uniref:Importin subunit alpha n=1 Tax=Alexandrium monilatum TaxID=311494 RepID=A0A6T1LNL5_9DINO